LDFSQGVLETLQLLYYLPKTPEVYSIAKLGRDVLQPQLCDNCLFESMEMFIILFSKVKR